MNWVRNYVVLVILVLKCPSDFDETNLCPTRYYSALYRAKMNVGLKVTDNRPERTRHFMEKS